MDQVEETFELTLLADGRADGLLSGSLRGLDLARGRIDVDVDVVLLDDLRVLDAGKAAVEGSQLHAALGVEGAIIAGCTSQSLHQNNILLLRCMRSLCQDPQTACRFENKGAIVACCKNTKHAQKDDAYKPSRRYAQEVQWTLRALPDIVLETVTEGAQLCRTCSRDARPQSTVSYITMQSRASAKQVQMQSKASAKQVQKQQERATHMGCRCGGRQGRRRRCRRSRGCRRGQ